MKMQFGQVKTGSFQGFGMKISGGSSSGAAGMKTAPRAGPAKAKPAVKGFFQNPQDVEDEEIKVRGLPSFSKPTAEALQAQRRVEEIAAADPTVFQYDEVFEAVKESQGREAVSQKKRTEVLEQKKRQGLTLMEGSEHVKLGSQREARYVKAVINCVDRRKVEAQMIEDRLLKKDKDKHEGCETFVTEAFKVELVRRKKFERELEEQDVRDQKNSAEKQENGLGFASMYKNLLNSGLASGRGGEKVKELAPAREELEVKEEPKVEEKEESKDEIKVEGTPGVAELSSSDAAKAAVAKAAEEAENKETRQDKAMSAKERFLARKRKAAELTEE